jgi:hypothetical protein
MLETVNGELVEVEKSEGIIKLLEKNSSNWLHPSFAFRITAPAIMAKMYPAIYAYFSVMGYPIEVIEGEMVHLYCPSIDENDKGIIREHNLLVEELRDNHVSIVEFNT